MDREDRVMISAVVAVLVFFLALLLYALLGLIMALAYELWEWWCMERREKEGRDRAG